MKRKSIERTIQYWILTDRRTGEPVGSVNWPAIVEQWAMTRPTVEVDGADVQGIGYKVAGEWRGLTLSKVRDHVPKQGEFNGGSRDRVRVNRGWHAIDDAFIYFCGPGNVIAVMAESLQAMRINRITEWLDLMLEKPATDPDFSWSNEAVVDSLRRQRLEDAHGLKMAHFEGVLGRSTQRVPGLIRALTGQAIDETRVDGIKVEIKITAERKHGSFADEEQILSLLTEHLGHLDADTTPGTRGYSKFSVKPHGSPNEIDLIKQRLTRKRQVQFNDGPTQAIFADKAFEALYGSFEADREDIQVGLEDMFEKGTIEEWDTVDRDG